MWTNVLIQPGKYSFLLGNVFSYRCKLSQLAQLHVWSLYVSPVLRSGLAALPVRQSVIKTIINFHHKILRGILKLSPRSPLAPLYFLLGELPMEAALHLDILTLFRCVWANPQTKIHEIIKYLLMITDSSSHTWAAHLRSIFQLYRLQDPLHLLRRSKEKWKCTINTAVISHTEVSWREKAARKSKLGFLNIQVAGLTGKPNPVLSGILTTQEVVRSRVHIKMLAGDYPCQFYLGSDRQQDSACLLCQALTPDIPAPSEDMVHLLTRCRTTIDTRTRVTPELLNTISKHFPNNAILNYPNQTNLTQLILDPTSINLLMNVRITLITLLSPYY